MPVILATWEAEIGRVEANTLTDPISKTTVAKWTLDVAQRGRGPALQV
jgi:hypothetical protein